MSPQAVNIPVVELAVTIMTVEAMTPQGPAMPAAACCQQESRQQCSQQDPCNHPRLRIRSELTAVITGALSR